MPKQSDALKVVVHYKPDTVRMVQAILAVLLWPCPRPVEDESRLNEEGGSKVRKSEGPPGNGPSQNIGASFDRPQAAGTAHNAPSGQRGER
jgi:hypothetical protein